MAATAPHRFLNLNDILKHCISARPQRQENKNQHGRFESAEEIKSYPPVKKPWCKLVDENATDVMQLHHIATKIPHPHRWLCCLVARPQTQENKRQRGRVERSEKTQSYPPVKKRWYWPLVGDPPSQIQRRGHGQSKKTRICILID